MTLFEQLKSIPKVDLHINLTSSISTNLAFDLSDETSIQDVEEQMIQKNAKDYFESLKLPISILRNRTNIELAINDLINRLEKDNVIYSELFLDLPLYNNRIDEEKLLKIILDTIKDRNFNMNVVLCLSDKKTKEENLATIAIAEKYYLNGVNGLYFQKDKMTNISDYIYIFDYLNRNNISYILNLDTKITNQDYEIYKNAKRVIYSLSEIDSDILELFRASAVMLEFPLSSLWENNIITGLKDYFFYDIYKENMLVSIVSRDMTTLNTDILNEYCLLFNNSPITVLELVKMTLNVLANINVDAELKNKLIIDFKGRSNELL